MELPPDKEATPARRKRLLRQLSKVLRASLGNGLIGTLFPFPSVLVSDLQKHPYSLYGTELSTAGYQDMVGSLLMLSSLPGAWLTAAVAVQVGRRRCMMANGALAVVGWLSMALLPWPAGILASRCVSGFAIGGLTVVVNAYVTELADDEVRGMMSMALNLAIMTGQVVTVVLGYWARYYTVAFINALIPAAFVAFLVWMPESPSILVLKGEDEKATEVLLELRGEYADVKGEMKSYRELNQAQVVGAGEYPVWRRLLQRSVLFSLMVVSSLFIIVAFSGFLVINTNTSQMFDAAGTSLDGDIAAIVIMLAQFGGGIAGFFLMDKIGRKNILYLGFTLMTAALGSMAVYSGLRQGSDSVVLEEAVNSTSAAWAGPVEGEGGGTPVVPMLCLVSSQTGASLGVSVMPFVLSQEYFPTGIRSQASSICFTIYTIATFVVLQLFTPMREGLTQAGLYGFYGGVCLLGIPFTSFLLRETMGQQVG